TDPAPVAGVEQIHGDREHDLARLAGREWDAVIDTSGYLPRVVRSSAELLAGAVQCYAFVSSISAYGRFPRADLDEDAPPAPAPPACSTLPGRSRRSPSARCSRRCDPPPEHAASLPGSRRPGWPRRAWSRGTTCRCGSTSPASPTSAASSRST